MRRFEEGELLSTTGTRRLLKKKVNRFKAHSLAGFKQLAE
jgi:hypothetical protein